MSSFCVFGMTELLAREMAEEQIGWTAPGEGFQRPRQLTREERDELVSKRAAELFEKRKARQISPEFDAPQFAQDWIAVAKRSTGVRGLQVMGRGEKRDPLGNVVISKITKRPVITWVPYIVGG